METTEIDLVKEIHEEYQIPIKNVQAAAAIVAFVNEITDLNKHFGLSSMTKVEKALEHPIFWYLSDGVRLEMWSNLIVFCETFRMKTITCVIERGIAHALRDGNLDLLSKSIFLASQHAPRLLLSKECFDKIVDQCGRANYREPLYILSSFNIESSEKLRSNTESDRDFEIFKTFVLIDRSELKLESLTTTINRYNPYQRHYQKYCELIFENIIEVMALRDDSKLIEMAKRKTDSKEEESLAIFSLIELIKRRK